MRSASARILKRIRHDKTPADTNDTADFSEISDYHHEIAVKPIHIKRPSHILPSAHPVNKHDAFRAGAKAGTGAKMFYGVIPGIKQALNISPATKKGKLADAINETRNEARTLHTNIQKLSAQFERVMIDDELSDDIKQEAAQLALYFLEDSFFKLEQILTDLKTYTGLLKGNAIRDIWGNIIADKEPLKEKDPRLIQKEWEKKIELDLLLNLAHDPSILNEAKRKLSAIDVSEADYQQWKRQNSARIEVTLNIYRGAGSITGIAIQGSVFSAINFGVAAATLNPVVFAAGAYYAASTVVRIGEVATKTHLQNNIIRANLSEQSQDIIDEHARSEQTARHHSHIQTVDHISKAHNAVDTIANTGFIASATAFQLIVSTDRPRLFSEENSMNITSTRRHFPKDGDVVTSEKSPTLK